MIDLTVCIVNFNTAELTCKCIDSILAHTEGISFEIIVIDNASSDESVAAMRQRFGTAVQIIENPTNRFFSGGFNQGIFMAQGRYTLILNSDTYLIDNALRTMVAFLDANPGVGAVEGTIVDEGTKTVTQTSSRECTPFREELRKSRLLRLLFRREYNRYTYHGWDRKSSRQVEVVCDAFMMARTALVRGIGGYNEALKLYYTEEYLSDKIRNEGATLWHLAEAQICHEWSSSTKKVSRKFIDTLYRTDRLIYFSLRKFYSAEQLPLWLRLYKSIEFIRN